MAEKILKLVFGLGQIQNRCIVSGSLKQAE